MQALEPNGNGDGGGAVSGNSLSGTGSGALPGNTPGASGEPRNAPVLTAGLKTPTGPGAAAGDSRPKAAPILRTTVPPGAAAADPGGTTQVVPLRVIQLALSLPTTSYFSNYEAFVAERATSKDSTQLIKLVYIFLPYQRRLTEYGISNKTFKLRVTRDPSCDESLMSMTWPERETNHLPGQAPDNSGDKLPCYRTTADDYRKALAGAR